jgi:hypothetical protein
MATKAPFPRRFHQGYNEVPRLAPGWTDALLLGTASTAESFTVPAMADGTKPKFVVFSYTSNTYVNCYVTATVPGDTSDGTASELNPAAYMLSPDITTISVISPVANAIVTASYYA